MIKASVLGGYSNSREEQVDLLREHVANLNVVHIDTRFFMIYSSFPRICADAVLHFSATHDGFPVEA